MAIKITSRRVNALEYIVIPELIMIQDYISMEIDESEREAKFIVKKVLANKLIQIEEEALIQAAFLKSKGKDSGADGDEDLEVVIEEEGDIIF